LGAAILGYCSGQRQAAFAGLAYSVLSLLSSILFVVIVTDVRVNEGILHYTFYYGIMFQTCVVLLLSVLAFVQRQERVTANPLIRTWRTGKALSTLTVMASTISILVILNMYYYNVPHMPRSDDIIFTITFVILMSFALAFATAIIGYIAGSSWTFILGLTTTVTIIVSLGLLFPGAWLPWDTFYSPGRWMSPQLASLCVGSVVILLWPILLLVLRGHRDEPVASRRAGEWRVGRALIPVALMILLTSPEIFVFSGPDPRVIALILLDGLGLAMAVIGVAVRNARLIALGIIHLVMSSILLAQASENFTWANPWVNEVPVEVSKAQREIETESPPSPEADMRSQSIPPSDTRKGP